MLVTQLGTIAAWPAAAGALLLNTFGLNMMKILRRNDQGPQVLTTGRIKETTAVQQQQCCGPGITMLERIHRAPLVT
jgi:hypothetical protein